MGASDYWPETKTGLRHKPAQTVTNRHRPAQIGTNRHKPAFFFVPRRGRLTCPLFWPIEHNSGLKWGAAGFNSPPFPLKKLFLVSSWVTHMGMISSGVRFSSWQCMIYYYMASLVGSPPPHVRPSSRATLLPAYTRRRVTPVLPRRGSREAADLGVTRRFIVSLDDPSPPFRPTRAINHNLILFNSYGVICH